ncbi:MAG: HAD-superfamily hydrolase, subfamily IIA [candidate division TA06 bacterium 32_111]|uniref:HAD-superfamily hydrolase, subfamily IIA n=1 Tax=candidate division TA06 bacterium 34_109 TaxID=1635277 RepID=A0A124G076_UNCT6|nr:MAG: HAD-superfamily hydrolase, subfamily IIA [candidate division TA06 bacterium 32_111]KUK86695.1 MAG: HAD-superfamily hydrolase, subfamily IIA [candidate division TA06 bacterium 34_109]HCP17409.1 HAD family hydrolase [candidate division WOR-3 bacterium]
MIYHQNHLQLSNGNKLPKIFFFDMDGTLYLGDILIDGSVQFLNMLKNAGIKRVFLSNNSSKNRKDYYLKLKRMGFEVKVDEIFTSLNATILKMKRENIKKIFPLGTPSFEEELRENDFILTDKDPEVVLLGFDKSLTYEKIEKAYRFLKGGKRYIATHPDILCPTEDGFIPDIGCFISMFEKCTSRLPEIVGKPNIEMITNILNHYSIDRNDAVMVGDRLYTDMRMAVDAKVISVLVLSGETKIEDYEKSNLDVDIVCDSVKDLFTVFPL